MSKNNFTYKYLLISVLLLLSSALTAQSRKSSPYSIFGIGKINHPHNVKTESMGGIGIAYQDNYTINFVNPASYVAFDSASFVFDVGISASSVYLADINIEEKASYASMHYLSFGFPVTKWWKTSFGMVPFSDVSYNFISIEELNNVGYVKLHNQGSGGINQFFWGSAFKINKNFSAGINMSYLFGTIDKIRTVLLQDTEDHTLAYSRGTYYRNSVRPRDFYLDCGLQYQAKLNNKLVLTLGAIGGTTNHVAANQDSIVQTFIGAVSTPRFIDTFVKNNIKGDLLIPQKIGFGISIQKQNKWLLSADFKQQYWKNYKSFGVADTLKNSLLLAVGGEFIPDRGSLSSYWKRVSYRMGLHYEKSNLTLKGQSINEFGISFGTGLPLTQSKSTVNLGLEFGKTGTKVENLIKESYIKFTLGISMHQRWFMKYKYF